MRLRDDFKFHAVPTMRVPEWADTFRRLPAATTAVPGQWRTEAREAARGIMMSVHEPGVRTITLACAVQLLKTEFILNVIGYHMHLDPCPMLAVMPKEDAAAKFSRERVGPMIRECPVLRERVDTRTRMGEDSLSFKNFSGGFLAIEGAGSPMNLASRAVRITLFDECDKAEMTREGHPIQLAEERTATFGESALHIRCCSPTVTDHSAIWKSYLQSDQRRAFIKCPHCDYEMSPQFFKHVDWPKTESGEHVTTEAYIYCESCGAAWSEDQRRKAITTKGGIRWYQTRPFNCCDADQEPIQTRKWEWDEENQIGYALCSQCNKRAVSNRHAGYQASKLLSPQITVASLAEKWIIASQNPDDKLTFRNTQLGEPADVEVVIENIDIRELMARRENFPDNLPDEICALFAGVDVQTGSDISDGSLHFYLWGIAVNREMWSVYTKIIPGDVRLPHVWNSLDELLLEKFPHETVGPMGVMAAAIDAGDGKVSEIVENFCKARKARNIFAIKGASEKSGGWKPIWPPMAAERTRHTGYRMKVIGSNSAKMAVYNRLAVAGPGPGYMHFGMDWTPERFEQLTAERLARNFRGGFEQRRFVLPRGRANEALDGTAYSLVALEGWLAHSHSLEKIRRLIDNMKGKKDV